MSRRSVQLTFLCGVRVQDIMGDAQLGTESLAIIYAVFAIGNFVSPIVVQKLGARPCMVLVRAQDRERECVCV